MRLAPDRAFGMSLAPLLDGAPAIPAHAFAAMAALVIGVIQLWAPKGTLPHRTLGWIWALLMLAAAISSFWIHEIRLVGDWSPIHLLSILVLITVPLAVWRAVARTDHARRRVWAAALSHPSRGVLDGQKGDNPEQFRSPVPQARKNIRTAA